MTLTPNCVYRVRHSSGPIRWKYLRTAVWHSEFARSVHRHIGTNLDTGREVVLKSTAKVVHELESPHGTEMGRGNYWAVGE